MPGALSVDKLQILVVEDNRNMRLILATLLNAAGIRHIQATADGRVAFDLVQKTHFDAALIDFQLEGMDGLSLTRRIRQERASLNPKTPIIMVSGHTELSRILEARDAGVTEFVTKPVTAHSLLTRLDTALVQPRAFVSTRNFVGPDRRRKKPPPQYNGPFRRALDGVFD